LAVGRLENVTKVYRLGRVEVPALRGISISVGEGEFLSIAGPSGSGKTTVLNIMGCLDKPTSGRVYVDGRDVSGLGRGELADIRNEGIGFVFQTFNLIPVLTAFENVELPLLLLRRWGARERREMVESILEDVGLGGLESRRPSELSGGQQQRVAIARALVKRPKLVLADEPTANLDSETGRGILELMAEMNEKHGIAFVFSTHDRMVMDYAKRLIRLRDGRVESDEVR